MLLHNALHASFVGFWLGLLNRDLLHQVDRTYYDNQKFYRNEDYNRKGLFDWEKPVIQQYFSRCKKILVIGAGGGREVLALGRLGYEVDGYECNPLLVEAAQKIISCENLNTQVNVQFFPRDGCPDGEINYDGAIVGWSAYMLIQGRETRVAFLKALRKRLLPNSPVLLSFFHRKRESRSYKLTFWIANLFRRLKLQERIELGDDLVPNFVHNFSKEEVDSELREGGFSMIVYNDRPYGHAVGVVR